MHLFLLTLQLIFWHAFDGQLEEVFTEIVQGFNQKSTPQVVLVKKKNYQVLAEEGLAEGPHPHILQLYEVATLSAMEKGSLFKPVEDLISIDPESFIDGARRMYSTPYGKMLSLPWNASTGILFYNKEAFAKAGLDPERPPKTWEEFEQMAPALKEAGFIGYTTAWPAAYHLELPSCIHNIPFASFHNGFDGISARLVCNNPKMASFLEQVCRWQKGGYFAYFGRYNDEPEKQFISGKCAILLQGANRQGNLEKSAPFPLGFGPLPYCACWVDAPYTLSLGGSSLWVYTGLKQEEYAAISAFFTYLCQPEIQALWHQKTGYLPISKQAHLLTQQSGFYTTHPAQAIAVQEVLHRPLGGYSWGIRLGDYTSIRNLITDKLELAFQGTLSAQQALDQAVHEGNQLLDRFEVRDTVQCREVDIN